MSSQTTVEYPKPSIKETGRAEEALLANHKTEPFVTRRSSESFKLAASLIIYCFPCVSASDWLHIFLAYHSNAETEN
uniref:Uncharacterized protein n=1 Tax=Mesocestoides corti TaxID=53468 RepID=A0A5K3FSN6_MESCO